MVPVREMAYRIEEPIVSSVAVHKIMRRNSMLKTTLALAAAVLAIGSAVAAAPQPTYVQFSGAAKGALYKPDPALFPSPHVGVIVMHRDSNYLNHISTKELPKRGFVVLGMNPRCDNNEAACAPWENN